MSEAVRTADASTDPQAYAAGPAGRIARVRALMAERGYDAVLVREEPNLRWLTGAAGAFDFSYEFPHAALITADDLYLHTDSRYYNTFVERLPADGPVWQLDQERVAIPRWVAQHARAAHSRTLAIEDSVQLSFYRGLTRSLEDLSAPALVTALHGEVSRMRAVKDSEEVALMRRAQAITDAAFTHMCAFIRAGLTEKQIRAELERFMYEQGADGLAFPTIVASGPNSANPHAVPSDRVVERGDFVLMDYGARYGDYNADMTRTVVVGEPAAWQREVYDAVRKVNEEVEATARAGVIGSDMQALAEKRIDEAGFAGCFGHGLGHGVGIEIHEQPNFNRGNHDAIPAGAVVTDEPGIYLPGKGGVRLEDYGLVTETGYEPFTQSTHDLISVG